MNLSALTTIPKIGPATYSVFGINGIPLAPGAASPQIDFRWPRAVFVTAFLVSTGSGADADASHLEIEIVDETQQHMFSDGQGGGFFVPALALHGKAVKPFDLQRPVVDGDHWFIRVRNTFPGEINFITPFVTLFFDEPFLKAPAVRGSRP